MISWHKLCGSLVTLIRLNFLYGLSCIYSIVFPISGRHINTYTGQLFSTIVGKCTEQ